jgi:hypothetical protein
MKILKSFAPVTIVLETPEEVSDVTIALRNSINSPEIRSWRAGPLSDFQQRLLHLLQEIERS